MRETVLNGDSYTKPVVNLIQNPSAETAGGSSAVFTNMLQNPKAEGVVSGTTFVRTNLCPDPACTVLTNRASWGGVSGIPFTPSTVSVTGMTRPTAYRWTAAGNSSSSTAANGVGPITAATPGLTYTGSIDARCSVPESGFCEIKFFDSSSNTLGQIAGNTVTMTPNTVYRLSCTATAPTGTVKMQAIFVSAEGGTKWSVGDYFDVTATLIEQTDQYRPYFDGASTTLSGWAYGWSGTANASASTAKCAAVTVRQNFASDPAATAYKTSNILGWESTRWPSYSTYSLVTGATDGPISQLKTYSRITCATTNTEKLGWHVSNNAEGASVDITATYPVTWASGLYVTLSAYVRSSSGTAFNIFIRFADSTGTWLAAYVPGNAVGSGSPNTWNRVSVSTTVPTGAAYMAVNVEQVGTITNQVGDVFDATGLLVELNVVSAGSYFDGNTKNFSDFSTSWSGTANLSTSLCAAAQPANWSINQQYGYTQLYQHTNADGTHSIRVRYPANNPSGGYRVLMGNLDTPTNLVNGSATTLLLKESSSWGSYVSGFNTIARGDATGGIGVTYGITTASTPTSNTITVTNTATATSTAGFYRGLPTSTISPTVEHYFDFYQGAIFSTSYGGSYFDGSSPASGDFTYGWTGSANLSSSTMNATLINGWQNNNAQPVQSSEWAASGSKSIRVVATGPTNDTFVRVNLWATGILKQGSTYTILATMRQIAPLTGTPAGVNQARNIFIDVDGGGNGFRGLALTTPQINAAGTYEHRLRFTVPPLSAGAVTYLSARLYNGYPAGSGDVWWDNVMLVEGAYNGPYLDGDSPGASWTGTAHASTSKGYPQSPLLVKNTWPNVIPNASNGWLCETGTGGVVSTTYVTGGGPNNADYVRYTWTTAATGGTVVGGANATSSLPSAFPPGQTITFSLWVRSSAAFLGGAYLYFYPLGVATSVGSFNSNTLTPGIWTRVSYTATVPLGIPTRAPYIQFRSASGSLATVGTTLDVTMAHVTVGGSLSDYSNTGWAYPPQLPSGYKVDTSAASMGSSLPTNLGATPANPATSWYTVIQVNTNGTASSVYPYLIYGDALDDSVANGASTLRVNQITGSTAYVFLRRSGGTGVGASPSPVAYAPGIYVIAHGINASGYQYVSVNGATGYTDSQIMNHASTNYSVQTSSMGVHLRTIAYPGSHTSAQRSQIITYLRNKYGA